jgi:hypothetical protein
VYPRIHLRFRMFPESAPNVRILRGGVFENTRDKEGYFFMPRKYKSDGVVVDLTSDALAVSLKQKRTKEDALDLTTMAKLSILLSGVLKIIQTQ